MPEATLKALADHGEIGQTLPERSGYCDEVLAKFAKAGIDTDALAAQLQEEGGKAFVKSWNELLASIASKGMEPGKGQMGNLGVKSSWERWLISTSSGFRGCSSR